MLGLLIIFIICSLLYPLHNCHGRPEPNYSLYVIIGVIVWGHFGRSLNCSKQSNKRREPNQKYPISREIFAITRF